MFKLVTRCTAGGKDSADGRERIRAVEHCEMSVRIIEVVAEAGVVIPASATVDYEVEVRPDGQAEPLLSSAMRRYEAIADLPGRACK